MKSLCHFCDLVFIGSNAYMDRIRHERDEHLKYRDETSSGIGCVPGSKGTTPAISEAISKREMEHLPKRMRAGVTEVKTHVPLENEKGLKSLTLTAGNIEANLVKPLKLEFSDKSEIVRRALS